MDIVQVAPYVLWARNCCRVLDTAYGVLATPRFIVITPKPILPYMRASSSKAFAHTMRVELQSPDVHLWLNPSIPRTPSSILHFQTFNMLCNIRPAPIICSQKRHCWTSQRKQVGLRVHLIFPYSIIIQSYCISYFFMHTS